MILFHSCFVPFSLFRFVCLSSCLILSRETKNFFFLFIENESWMGGTAIKIYLHKMMRSHNEFRKIFGFFTFDVSGWMESNEDLFNSWVRKKNTPTRVAPQRAYTDTPQRRKWRWWWQGKIDAIIRFSVGHIFIWYRRAILHPVQTLLITKTNKYRLEFIAVIFLWIHLLCIHLSGRAHGRMCLFALVMVHTWRLW